MGTGVVWLSSLVPTGLKGPTGTTLTIAGRSGSSPARQSAQRPEPALGRIG
jgi:hypothetical protein